MRNPVFQIVIGFVLVLLAAILSWLIVLGYIPSSFPLDLSVFAMSMGGLMLGIVGSATYVKFTWGKNKKKEE
jgi:hypothetical protein